MENVLKKMYISVAKAKNNAQLLFEEHVEHTHNVVEKYIYFSNSTQIVKLVY